MKRKIYDCFLFFDELDLLWLRLNELNSVVDTFVLHESTKTHQGNPKPLYYEENKERFKDFHHKIIHRIIDDTPDNFYNLTAKAEHDSFHNLVIKRVNKNSDLHCFNPSYGRDCYEKESLIRSLNNCSKNDVILLSDLDEIPNFETLKNVIDNFDDNEIYHFQQDMFFYYLNLRKEDDWQGTIAMSYGKYMEQSYVEVRASKRGVSVPNGGWHFSYLGDVDTIRRKLESFSHKEFNVPQIKNNLKYSIDNCIVASRDLFGRPCNFWTVPITDLPRYIQKNRKNYRKYLLCS